MRKTSARKNHPEQLQMIAMIALATLGASWQFDLGVIYGDDKSVIH
jgi:hypothetical protein